MFNIQNISMHLSVQTRIKVSGGGVVQDEYEYNNQYCEVEISVIVTWFENSNVVLIS